MKKYIFSALLALAFTVSQAVAHPGNTTADGCHYCRINCAEWGQLEGQRHCHHARQSRRGIEQPPLGAWGSGGRGASPKRPTSSLGGVPRIIDADTLELSKQRVRLQGIDAPESAQSCRLTDGRRYQCGKQATAALQKHLGRAAIRCAIDGRDRYGRGLGTCYTSDGTNLNAWLVQQGHALAYRPYSTEYVPDEDHARAGRAGIWGGEFVPPWEWRRGVRLQ